MSRINKIITRDIVITYGSDHVLGFFIEARDKSLRKHEDDEGIIFMFDQKLGIWEGMRNLIDVTWDEIKELGAGEILDLVTERTRKYAETKVQ